MTKNEAIKMLEDLAELKDSEIELHKKYPGACLNNTKFIQFLPGDFMHLIEVLESVVVTFDPCWFNSDPDYLKGSFEYVIKGEIYKIVSLIPKTKEEK